MKIYTRTGDNGSTGLLGNQRVSKADQRIDCIGVVDELNAALGLALAAAPESLKAGLAKVQHELFTLGSHLAAPDEKAAGALPPLTDEMIARLEQEIDRAESQNPPLSSFILPGGTESAARLHFARTVCRRAERLVVRLSESQNVDPFMIKYLNRLADWLFAIARNANHLAGVADIPWLK